RLFIDDSSMFLVLFFFCSCFCVFFFFFFFSSRRRHTRWPRDWSSDVCSSDLCGRAVFALRPNHRRKGAWKSLWSSSCAGRAVVLGDLLFLLGDLLLGVG